MERRIAVRYARALFNAAKKADVVASVGDDLIALTSIVENDEKLKVFLLSPDVNRADKVRLIERVFSDRVTALTMSVLRLLLDKRREELFFDLGTIYAELRREYENVLHVDVVSATPLSDDQRTAILAKVSQATGKKIEAEYELQPGLIGGVQVRYGDYVLDGTLRGGLDRLRERLVYDLMKRS